MRLSLLTNVRGGRDLKSEQWISVALKSLCRERSSRRERQRTLSLQTKILSRVYFFRNFGRFRRQTLPLKVVKPQLHCTVFLRLRFIRLFRGQILLYFYVIYRSYATIIIEWHSIRISKNRSYTFSANTFFVIWSHNGRRPKTTPKMTQKSHLFGQSKVHFSEFCSVLGADTAA
jgi:hypothetical protein